MIHLQYTHYFMLEYTTDQNLAFDTIRLTTCIGLVFMCAGFQSLSKDVGEDRKVWNPKMS